MPSERTHKCPIGICIVEVPRTLLMCRTHWKMVPLELNHEVYRAYRQGTITEHLAACDAAVNAVEERLAAQQTG